MRTPDLYPEPRLHRRIPHPATGAPVRLMSPRGVVLTAAGMLEGIRRSGRKTVLVLESGAALLARACRELSERQGLALKWRSLKIAREDPGRRRLSGEIPPQEPLIILDEYVDSGTTMAGAFACLAALGHKPPPEIVCHGWLAKKSALGPHLRYASFRGRNPRNWQRAGAYPGENRIDLIGSFFLPSDPGLGPRPIGDYAETVSAAAARRCDAFLSDLAEACRAFGLPRQVAARCRIKAVRNAFVLSHCLRALLARFERTPERRELLEQLADMYGPMWSPYPDRYHLDFCSALRRGAADFQNLSGLGAFEKRYAPLSRPMVALIVRGCERRRLAWNEKISRAIEEVL